MNGTMAWRERAHVFFPLSTALAESVLHAGFVILWPSHLESGSDPLPDLLQTV